MAGRRDGGRENEEYSRREAGKTEPPIGKHCLVSHQHKQLDLGLCEPETPSYGHVGY